MCLADIAAEWRVPYVRTCICFKALAGLTEWLADREL